jgi:hypothetical protein
MLAVFLVLAKRDHPVDPVVDWHYGAQDFNDFRPVSAAKPGQSSAQYFALLLYITERQFTPQVQVCVRDQLPVPHVQFTPFGECGQDI